MKTLLICATLLQMSFNLALSQGLGLPDDSSLGEVMNTSLPNPFTEAELGEPPAGKIQLKYLRDVNQARAKLGSIMATVPPGPNGQGAPEFVQLQVVKEKLDQLALSHLESDLFEVMQPLLQFAKAEQENTPTFVTASFEPVQDLSIVFLYVGARHITNVNTNAQHGFISKFVNFFSTERPLIFEADWENKNLPVDEAGILILDATAVATQLMAGPWQQAKRFLGGATTASGYFARYSESGDGLAVLKTKYAANQLTIDAKFNELKMWADQQEQQAGSDD